MQLEILNGFRIRFGGRLCVLCKLGQIIGKEPVGRRCSKLSSDPHIVCVTTYVARSRQCIRMIASLLAHCHASSDHISAVALEAVEPKTSKRPRHHDRVIRRTHPR